MPFHDRVTKWQKEREAEATRRKQLVDTNEVLNCTFKPRINATSERAVKELRGNDNELANERLFKNSELY